MKIILKNATVLLVFAVLLLPGLAFAPEIARAHQPRIVEGTVINVVDPEVSKAYYGTLSGQPHVYKISSDKPFSLYAGVLVPDRPGQKKDVSAAVVKMEPVAGAMASPPVTASTSLANLDGKSFKWEPMYEEFGADNYFKGPEFKQQVPAGNYEIRVSSPDNDSRYSLAVGEIEAFDLAETVNALTVIPKLKSDFFGSSPFTFLKSPFGIGYVVIMFVFAFVFGFIYRVLLKKFAINKMRQRSHNIGKNDRFFRALLGAGLLVLGIVFWNPWMLFFAGFCFFEAIFSWCGLYAALGKNSCPL